MSNARLVLAVLICAAPVILLFDGPIMHGLVAGVAAIAMAIVSRTMRAGETTFFLSIARPAALFAAIPALWMLIQVLPLGVFPHPIWASAQSAIGHPIRGAISVDIGAGVMGLGEYLTIAAIGFWAGAIAVDRQRAEWILFSLMAGTALIGLTTSASMLFGRTALSTDSSFLQRMQEVDGAAMGVTIAAAAAIRTWERYETRHASPDRSVAALVLAFVACGVALLLCLAALSLVAGNGELVATAYGAAVFVSVVLIRRFGLGRWGTVGIALPGIAVAVLLVVSNNGIRTGSFSLAFATEPPGGVTSMTERMLDDAPLLGTGAGTFAAIAPIYRDIDEKFLPVTAPSAAAAVALELGRPALWLIVAMVIGAIIILLRASLQRGRDSFYPTAGASCLITLLFLFFLNAGSLGTAAALIAAATVGVALAQSKSRSVQQ